MDTEPSSQGFSEAGSGALIKNIDGSPAPTAAPTASPAQAFAVAPSLEPSLQPPPEHAGPATVEAAFAPLAPPQQPVPDPEPALDPIDWTLALEQCGGDDEFMHEILVDLMSETGGLMDSLTSTLSGQGSLAPQPLFTRVSQTSHAIKGAMANLSCNPVRLATFKLEQFAASCAKQAYENMADPLFLTNLQESGKLRDAVGEEFERLRGELRSKGIEC
ncbi:hypothetical protein TrRE_jg2113 [Triparma retinervis]|uniref:HPt domain-containing protein n=1 Tax=Triparma retinervis TaxID=2557542 RepID=A0A9W7EEI4_9STRA|nr:hypothetical protein TrRE_jg2113 [Triparma retinervis]